MITTRDGKMITATGMLKPNTARVPALNIVAHGDSITADLSLSNYVYQLRTLIESGTGDWASVKQRGLNGISYDYRWPSNPVDRTMLTDAPIEVDTAQAVGIDNWLIVFAGTNGMAIGGHSAGDEYTDFKTYIAARISEGWTADNIVVGTMLPRTGFSEMTRSSFNTSLVGDDENYGYRVARFDLDTDIGEEDDNLDTFFYQDGIHPTVAGHAVIAQILYDTMFPA